VDIEIIDRTTNQIQKHSGQWLTSPPKAFLAEVCALKNSRDAMNVVETHHERVRLITEADGTVVGRAALMLSGARDESACIVSVGGFSSQRFMSDRYHFSDEVYDGSTFSGNRSVVGVVIGDTYDAARARASVTVSEQAIARWAQEQDDLLDVERFTPPARVSICHSLLKLGAESTKLPFGFLGGRFASVSEFRNTIAEAAIVDVPLSHTDYKNNFEFRGINNLTTPYFTSALHPTVAVVLEAAASDLLSEDERRGIVEQGRHTLDHVQARSVLKSFPLRFLASLTKEAWDSDIVYSIERVELVAGNALAGRLQSWALRLKKSV